MASFDLKILCLYVKVIIKFIRFQDVKVYRLLAIKWCTGNNFSYISICKLTAVFITFK